MKDFLNYEFTLDRSENGSIFFLMRHKKKDNVAIEFEVLYDVDGRNVPMIFDNILKAWAHEYAKKTRKKLTAGQKAFYDHMVRFCKENGRPPSYDEQRDFLGVLSKGTAYYYTNKLVASGWVWRDENGLAIPMDIQTPEMA